MKQDERRHYLLEYLLRERREEDRISIPSSKEEEWALLRALMNVRLPEPVSKEFLEVQDAYLQEEKEKRGIISLETLEEKEPQIYLWRGDITRLAVDAIVNAANNRLLGCFVPGHHCIDNAIHTYAGIQLRLACHELMEAQGYLEPTGQAKITKAYNLPSKYILHTVGPIITGVVTEEEERLLGACYESCLALADQHQLNSIAFCSISTGEFCFPNDRAAKIAIKTVRDYIERTKTPIAVVFNVFKEKDELIYSKLLG